MKIILQIGNPVADVNNKAETLLAAPELTNGYTMVPLRFISETFGADVSYDGATEQITVIKGLAEEVREMVEGAIDESKIGDSYFNRSMENPSEMQMTARSFDGTYTAFAYDENNYLDLSIYPIDEDYDFEKDFVDWKNDLKGFTLVKADKATSNANKKRMHFQAKDKTVFLDIWNYVTKEYLFILFGEFENEKADIRDEAVCLMETFDCSFEARDTYDLSGIKDGMRTFKSESLHFSIDIPQDYYMASSEDVENEVSFYKLDADDYNSSIRIGIYSKSAVGTAKEMAEFDYKNNKKSMNENLASFSENITEKEYASFSAFEYTYDINTNVAKERSRDVFFELGDYVYNVTVSVKMPNNAAESMIDAVINSIKAEEINASEAGILMRNIADNEGAFTKKGDGWRLAVPNSYTEVQSASDGVILQGMNNGIMVVFQKASAKRVTYNDMQKLLKELEDNAKEEKTTKIIQSTKQTTVGGINYADLILFQETEDGAGYIRQLAGVKDGVAITFTITYIDLAYSAYNIQEVEQIVKSLTLE